MKTADKLKIGLKSYEYYYKRYINYKNAAEYCDKNGRKKFLEKKIYLSRKV